MEQKIVRKLEEEIEDAVRNAGQSSDGLPAVLAKKIMTSGNHGRLFCSYTVLVSVATIWNS